MVTRYSRLRSTIAMLAAEPQAQVEHLDVMLGPLTDGSSAEGYGNIELIETFGDMVIACEHMLEFGEITQSELKDIRQLERVVDSLCANQDEKLWQRESLFSDVRWQQLRAYASATLARLPDVPRESDYTRNLGNDS